MPTSCPVSLDWLPEDTEVGAHFVFDCEPPSPDRPRSPRRVRARWDVSYSLQGGVGVPAHHLPVFDRPLVCSDKDLYRLQDDVVRLLLISPAHAGEEARVELASKGRTVTSRTLRLDSNGVGVVPLEGLLAGTYTARLGDASTTFEVAEYVLSPLAARETRLTLEDDGRVALATRLETLPATFSGSVEVTILEGEAVVHGPVPCEVVAGELRGSFPLEGEGPFVAHVRAPDQDIDVQIPIQGSAREDRERTWVTRLGEEVAARVMKATGARECRGLWLTKAAGNNAPMRVLDPVAPVGRIEAREPLEDVVVTVLHPTRGTSRTLEIGDVAAGDVLEVPLDGPWNMVVLGAFLDGSPWEASTAFLTPCPLTIEVEAPAQVSPDDGLQVQLRSSQPTREASVLVVVRDPRLRPQDTPRTGLAGRMKGWLEDWWSEEGPRKSQGESMMRRALGRWRHAFEAFRPPQEYDERICASLQAQGLVTPRHLERARTRPQASGRSLAHALVEMRVVTERDVTEALARLVRLPFLDLSNYIVDPAIAKLIPNHIAERHQMIPVNKVGNKLTVAMVDPFNIIAVDDIALMTGLQVKTVVSTPGDIHKSLLECYGQQTKMEELLDDIGGNFACDEEGTGDLGGIDEDHICPDPIIKLVNLILTQAMQAGVEQIAVDNLDEELLVRFRTGSDVHRAMSPPKRAAEQILGRLLVMAGVDPAGSGPRIGRIKIRVANQSHDLRLRHDPAVREGWITLDVGAYPAGTADHAAEDEDLPPARETDPDVLFAGVVTLRGEATLQVPLAGHLGHLEVEAFAVAGWDWCGARAEVEVSKGTFGELTVPRLLHPDDQATGRLDLRWQEPGARVRLTRDGEEVPLLVDGQPLAASLLEAPGHATARFELRPGRHEVIVEEASGRADRQVRDVVPPGTFRAHATRLRILRPGESLDLDGAEASAIRVLQDWAKPMGECSRVTARYQHSCCEQTASKILSAVAWYTTATDEADRRAAESSILAGIAREEQMWVRGQGFEAYPGRGLCDTWGRAATGKLAWLGLMPVPAHASPELRAGLARVAEMVEDLSKAYQLVLDTDEPRTLYQAYRTAVRRPDHLPRALACVNDLIDVGGTQVHLRTGSATGVLRRVDACYAGATLLRTRRPRDFARGLAIFDWVGRQREATGRFYSSHDSSAAVLLAHELARQIGGAAGSLAIDGREYRLDAPGLPASPSRVKALDATVLLEVDQVVEHDWTKLRSNCPVRVQVLGGDPDRGLRAGERVKLALELEDYRDGDTAHVFLPPDLARIRGGGRQQSFEVDFAARRRVEIPVQVQGTRDATRRTQHWFACVRNMYDEERIGNPGVQTVALGS